MILYRNHLTITILDHEQLTVEAQGDGYMILIKRPI
jgi:hypothetical protein